MKKIVGLIIYFCLSVILLSACCISHEWDGGSCLESEKCIKCGKIHEGTEPTGHIATEWIIDKKVTCTEEGSKHTICSKCGLEYNDVIESSGHNMSDWEKSLEFNEFTGTTYTRQGMQSRRCSLCGYKETEETDLSVSEYESLARLFATECTYNDITFGETPDEYLKETCFYFSVISFTGKVINVDYDTSGVCYVNITNDPSGNWFNTIRLWSPRHTFSLGEVIKVYGAYWGPVQTEYGEIPNIEAIAVDR